MIKIQMRGEKLFKILNILEDSAIGIANISASFLNAGYGASLGKMDYEYNKLDRKADKYKLERAQKQESVLRLQKYLWKLKKDGLIAENDSKIMITKKGKMKLTLLKNQPLKNIQAEKSDTLMIISYDLPLTKEKMRQRLIEALKILGLKRIHQSLWAGKVKIPSTILKYFEEIHIL